MEGNNINNMVKLVGDILGKITHTVKYIAAKLNPMYMGKCYVMDNKYDQFMVKKSICVNS